MRGIHPSLVGVAMLGTATLLTLTVPVGAQRAAPSVPLYEGGSLGQEGIELKAWGSGEARVDSAVRASGDSSIRVKTNGYYAGARLQFLAPKDITAQKGDPNGYMEFVIRFRPGVLKERLERQRNMGPGGSGGYPGGPPGGGSTVGSDSSGAGPGLPGSQFGGSGGSGYPGGYPGGEQSLEPDTKKVKAVIVGDDGKQYVASNFPVTLLPAPNTPPEGGWFTVAIPFVAFKGLDEAKSVKVREIRFFGDTTDTFWIGEIKTTTDDEPITVDPLDNLEVSKLDAVEFRATASGGISPLHYSWDFNKADGIQEDAVGQNVVHVFIKESPTPPGGRDTDLQPYVVTLTVSDLGGAKKPIRQECDVIVNP
jgi:hypothetical protein